MKPRNYGTLNRSIARATSYALRDNGRKTTYKKNGDDNIGCGVAIAIFILILLACL